MGRTAPDTFVLLRGNAHVPGDKVEPHFPQILTSTPPVIPEPAEGREDVRPAAGPGELDRRRRTIRWRPA